MAIDLIALFIVDISDFKAYQNDLKTQSAVERQLAIIGEALNQLHKTNPHITINDGKQIIAFRNRLVHAYDSINSSIVWAIIKGHLKKLKQEIQDLD